MTDPATLGTRLRARRRGAGLTLAEVAERSRLSLPYVSNLERGRGNPTIDALRALAGALDTSVSALLDDDEVGFDPLETVMAEAPASLATFSRSDRFVDEVRRLAERLKRDPEELRRTMLQGMATAPRRSTGDPTEYDWRRLMDAYVRILDDE